MKSGFIAITGRPNAGKSTLLNHIVGEKVAIVSSKPQTTRTKIMGVLTRDEVQLVFTDTPGFHHAHNKLEELCLDKETYHYKQQVALKFADLVYNGQWYTPLRQALSAFVDSTQETVTGDVKLKLYKGNIIDAGVTSPYSLYDEEIATFDEDEVYNQADSAGFINLFGLPIKVQAKKGLTYDK